MPETITDHECDFLRHEIGNALTTVRGYAELMASLEGVHDDVQRQLKQIILAVERATRLFEQLHPNANTAPLATPARIGPKSENRTGGVVLTASR
jgi:signal transduction histidine kinase